MIILKYALFLEKHAQQEIKSVKILLIVMIVKILDLQIQILYAYIEKMNVRRNIKLAIYIMNMHQKKAKLIANQLNIITATTLIILINVSLMMEHVL